MDKEKDEKSYHKININWDDTANAKTYSNHWKIRLFYFIIFRNWRKYKLKYKNHKSLLY